jgi:hypothetical protein
MALRKLGSSLCDVDLDSIADSVLSKKKKKKKTAPVGSKSSGKAQPADVEDDVSKKP